MMRDPITNLGGSRHRFPETTVGFLSQLQRWSGEGDRGAMEILCRRYWKPVYAYVRAAWSKSNEDAKDLTQAFFVWLMEQDVLENFAERGSFRRYLRVLLRRFVGHQEVALRRLKRGGGRHLLSFDESPLDLPDPRSLDPEAAFDRTWWTEVVSHAIERVRERCASGDAAVALKVYEQYDLAGPPRPTYAELATRLGLNESDIKGHLLAMRKEVSVEIHAELGRLTSDERDLREEWDALFGA